jgi:hypothetical protein
MLGHAEMQNNFSSCLPLLMTLFWNSCRFGVCLMFLENIQKIFLLKYLQIYILCITYTGLFKLSNVQLRSLCTECISDIRNIRWMCFCEIHNVRLSEFFAASVVYIHAVNIRAKLFKRNLSYIKRMRKIENIELKYFMYLNLTWKKYG